MTQSRRATLGVLAGVCTTGGCVVSGGRPRVTAAAASVESDVPLTLGLQTERSQFTESETAQLTLRVEWTGEEAIQFGTDPALFVPPGRSGEPAGVLLVHESDSVHRADYGRWVAEAVALPAVWDPHEPIPPGGERTQPYDVWADGDSVDRLRTGTYRFSLDRPVRIGESERAVRIVAFVRIDRAE